MVELNAKPQRAAARARLSLLTRNRSHSRTSWPSQKVAALLYGLNKDSRKKKRVGRNGMEIIRRLGVSCGGFVNKI